MRRPPPSRSRWRGLSLALALSSLFAARPAPAAPAPPASEVAARTWVTVRTAHVEVVTDAGHETGERVAQQLEDLRVAFADAAPGLLAEMAPVQVIVFNQRSLFDAYAPRWRGGRDELGGYFLPGSDRRRLLFADRPGRTLPVAQHEFTHALLDASMPELPLWLNEGLAEYWSTFRVDKGVATAGAPVTAHLEWLENNELMPLDRLFKIAQGSSDYHEGDRRGTFYAQSWALIHLLLSDPDDLGRLERCLVSFRDGQPFADAFASAFGSEETLRKRLITHLGKSRHPTREWQLTSGGARAVAVSGNTAPAGVLATLGNALLAHDPPQRELANEHLLRAVQLEPRQPEALAGLGWLELLAGRADSARALLTRAVRTEPVSVPAVRLAATEWLLVAHRFNDHPARDAMMTALREALGRARAAAPGDPELLSLLARTWVVEPGKDAEPGYAFAREAVQALPGRADVRLDLLALAALTGRRGEALALQARWFAHETDAATLASIRRALFAGELIEVNRLIAAQQYARAETLLIALRVRVEGDIELEREAVAFLGRVERFRRDRAVTDAENAAVREFNAGVELANQQRPRQAAEAFGRAERAAVSDSLRERSRSMAQRMQVRWRGEEAMALAKRGRETEAITILEGLLKPGLPAEERSWIEQNLAVLRQRRGR